MKDVLLCEEIIFGNN